MSQMHHVYQPLNCDCPSTLVCLVDRIFCQLPGHFEYKERDL